MILLIEGLEVTAVKSIADLLHKLVVEVKVVLNCKAHSHSLLCLDEVADIGSAVMAACGAATIFVNGSGVTGVLFIHNINLTVPCEHVAVTGIT